MTWLRGSTMRSIGIQSETASTKIQIAPDAHR